MWSATEKMPKETEMDVTVADDTLIERHYTCSPRQGELCDRAGQWGCRFTGIKFEKKSVQKAEIQPNDENAVQLCANVYRDAHRPEAIPGLYENALK